MKISDIFLKARNKLFIFRTLGKDGSHIETIAKTRLRNKIGNIEVDFNNSGKKKSESQNHESRDKSKFLDIPTQLSVVTKFAGADKYQKDNLSRNRQTVNSINNQNNYQESNNQQLLTSKKEIRGRRGRYECSSELIQETPRFKLYLGQQSQTNQKVIIKEYLLQDDIYNSEEVRKCKEKFAAIGNISISSEDAQDFRVISPLETIAAAREKSCYLITKQIENSITLRQQLEQTGCLSPKQVIKILDQTLQSLWYIHSKRFYFANGKINNGIPHGNLNLDSLLLVVDSQYNSSLIREPQLSVYLSDLGLWDNIFSASDSQDGSGIGSQALSISSRQSQPQSFAQDLIDLGIIGLQLLSGNTDTLNVSDVEENWFVEDSVLEAYIFCLLGIHGSFDSALTARQELLRLKSSNLFEYQQQLLLPNSKTSDITDSEEDETVTKQKRKRDRIIIWTSAILGMSAIIGGLSFFGIHRLLIAPIQASKQAPCCLDKIQLPTGKFSYAIDSKVWQKALEQKGFVGANKTIKNKLESSNTQLQNYQDRGLQKESLELLQQGKIDFALSKWNANLPSGLKQEEVAYHGLAVFVAFNDDNNRTSVSRAFKGKITIEQLRSLYTRGYADNIPPKKLKNWDVKLYVPFETEAINTFEKLLFDNSKDKRRFRELTQKILLSQKQKEQNSFYKHSTRELLGEIFNDAETKESVGIGFGFISQIFGQCAVYPLAIKAEGKAIQPLKNNNSKPISVSVDLCDDKGSYWLNSDEFSSQAYPLGYKLTVVYPEDNPSAGKKFAELLRTKEAQYLLREAGLIPLQSLEN